MINIKNVDLTYFMLFFLCGLSVLFYENLKIIKYKINKKLLFLEGDIYRNKYITIDKWYFTHLFFYSIMGYLYPMSFYLSMINGVIWELFEFYLGYYKPLWFFQTANTQLNTSKWWHGRISDLFVNCIGFTIGYSIHVLRY